MPPNNAENLQNVIRGTEHLWDTLSDAEVLSVLTSVLSRRGGVEGASQILRASPSSSRHQMGGDHGEDEEFISQARALLTTNTSPTVWPESFGELEKATEAATLESFGESLQKLASEAQLKLWHLKDFLFHVGGINETTTTLRTSVKFWSDNLGHWVMPDLLYRDPLDTKHYGEDNVNIVVTTLNDAFGSDYYLRKIPQILPKHFLPSSQSEPVSAALVVFLADTYISLAVHNLLCMAICLAIEARRPQTFKTKFRRHMFENAITFVAGASALKARRWREALDENGGRLCLIENGDHAYSCDATYYRKEAPGYWSYLASFPLLSFALTEVCIDLDIDELGAMLHGRRDFEGTIGRDEEEDDDHPMPPPPVASERGRGRALRGRMVRSD